MRIWLAAFTIGLGGALGALARVGLTGWWGDDPHASATLVVTLIINTTGAAALGVLRGLAPSALSPEVLAGVTVGFLGGFTTWSAVVSHSVITGQASLLLAAGYLLATVALGVAAAWAGLAWGERKAGASP